MNIVQTFCSKKKAEQYANDSGSRFRKQYVGKLDKETGNINLTCVGETDVYAEIQSHAGEADINNLIARAEAGDLSAFASAVFGDFTEFPKSYSEALNVVIEAEREFNHLPQEVRDKFNNDWHKYIVTAGTKEWLMNMGAKFDDEKPIKEVKNDEQEQ